MALITIRREGPITLLGLDRPDKLNAMTRPMWQALGRHMRELSADDSVRCVILRGAGGKAFSPGNDIAEFATERSNFEQGRAYGAVLHGALGAVAECRHPTLALIEGLPEDFVLRRRTYWRLARTLLDESYSHITDHLGQMRAAVVAARQGS